jgi:hypothetical protein
MASKAVNVATNTKQKEKDVNNKLQLYGIYSGEHFPMAHSDVSSLICRRKSH